MLIPTFSIELVESNTPVAREFAWQSRQEVGCGEPASASASWKTAFVDQIAVELSEGPTGHAVQGAVTIRAAVGAPPSHTTASCRISPLGGARVMTTRPRKPWGAQPRWQSEHAVGCGSIIDCSEAWTRP